MAMLERYLSHLLTSKFGHIIENFDEDNVRVSAWNGEVVLEDLHLKKNSLDTFLSDTPLEIRYGRIGKLELKIPWKVLRSMSKDVKCSIVLSDVCILITPKGMTATEDDDENTTIEQSRAKSRRAKEEKVQALMDANLFKRSIDRKGNTTQRRHWIHEWITSLLSNLSVTIINVHIRYEDPGNSFGLVWNKSKASRAFSVGITLKKFSVQTTDKGHPEDEESFTKAGGFTVTHKLAAAYQLSIYWDRGCPLMTTHVKKVPNEIGISSVEERNYFASTFLALNNDSIEVESVHDQLYKGIKHTYFLNPTSPSLQFSFVRETESEKDTIDKGGNKTLPPSSAVLTMPPTQLLITKNTLEDSAYVRKCFAMWNQTRKKELPDKAVRRLTRIRPVSSPSLDPRSWWKYAFEATIIILKSSTDDGELLPLIRRKGGWLGLARAIGSRNRYARLYIQLMASPSAVERTQIHQVLMKMEDDLEADAIVAYRIFAHGMGHEGILHDSDISVSDVDKVESHSLDNAERMDELYPLSVEHRIRMYQEMSMIVDNEKSGDPRLTDATREEHSQGQNESAIIWKALLICPEVSIQANEASREGGHCKKARRLKGKSADGKPIAKVACSPLYRHILRVDGSWNSTASIASFEILDLTSRLGTEGSIFPVLVGRKGYDEKKPSTEELVLIQGVEHRLCISVTVARKLSRGPDSSSAIEDSKLISTTTTTVRLLPLEVVYSTTPIAALSNLFLSVKTPELADDFHRMATVVSNWRENQRERLILALAHKEKKILVDIDVAAPVLFVPEDVNQSESPMLVIDLGRLQFRNADEIYPYDDTWKLGLSRVQVLTTTIASYRAPNFEKRLSHQIVEPFSLDFAISSSISAEETNDIGGTTLLHVKATLPRLVFNLNTSAVRLLLRLQRQWKHQIIERSMIEDGQILEQASSPIFSEQSILAMKNDVTKGNNRHRAREIKFIFSAPLIAMKLENDVDGRDCLHAVAGHWLGESSRTTTTLGHLLIRGISANYRQEISPLGACFGGFDAKMKSLQAVDLYQQAGSAFSLFMSSTSTDISSLETICLDKVLEGHLADPQVHEPEMDLVSIRFSSRKRAPGTTKTKNDVSERDTLAISFHELFVEWNPETVAAMHKAMQLPPDVFNVSENLSPDETSPQGDQDDILSIMNEGDRSDEEFFDALEGHDGDSPSLPFNGEDSGDLSEISTGLFNDDEEQFFVAHSALPTRSPYPISPMWYRQNFSPSAPVQLKYAPVTMAVLSPAFTLTPSDESKDHPKENEEPFQVEWRPFEVTFDLSKLSVNFNKETRHRRLIVAEMDGTSINFVTRPEGGSMTTARIGNLALSDPSSQANSTLYKEIVGLQSNDFTCNDRNQSSLLELTFFSNPNNCEGVPMLLRDTCNDANEEISDFSSVKVDSNRGTVTGCDYFVSLHFSPMRFVYLQQLWFEVIDYFFEGIIGTEVWGGNRPPPESTVEQLAPSQQGARDDSATTNNILPGADGNGMRFTKFVIDVEAPIVLIPVAYRSPQFLRFEFDSLIVTNYYHSSVERATTATYISDPQERVQWFNNCTVTLNELRIKSWCGTELSRTDPAILRPRQNAKISLSWPTGPGAQLVRPKWNVDCRIDDINIFLRRADYALLQHVIFHNIGEPSRHLNEWVELQAIPDDMLKQYKEQVMVHFGYDKKDVTPTTYKVEVKVSSLGFFLVEESTALSGESVTAEALCANLVWGMQKLSDCISRQRVTCDIVLSQPSIVDGIKTIVHLILPSELDLAGYHDTPAKALAEKSESAVPELVYTSTSRITGDNVKTLHVANACIHFVYPAWVKVASFFSGLEAPELWSEIEVGLTMQIGDRWYQISGSDPKRYPPEDVERKPITALRSSSAIFLDDPLPTYQFQLRLVAPRVVLHSSENSSERVSVVLRMDHFDYLNVNRGTGRLTRSYFVHNLELYTSARESMRRDIFSRKNSLIRPWSTIGIHDRCNGREPHCCDRHEMTIHAEVLQARAAYSDMSIAVDVGLRFLSDIRSSASRRGRESAHTTSDKATPLPAGDNYACSPGTYSIVVGLEGLDVLVIDDSFRHFAGSQALLELSLNGIRLHRVRKPNSMSLLTFSTRIELDSMNLVDHLQPVESLFRLAATSQECGIDPERRNAYGSLKWAEYSCIQSDTWGIIASKALTSTLSELASNVACTMAFDRSLESSCAVDIQCIATESKFRKFDGRLTTLTLQWNPSTVIALQRFLGRLVKEANQKAERSYQRHLGDLLIVSTATEHIALPDGEMQPEPGYSAAFITPIVASLRLECLTLCFNKEHQNRRLLKATFTNSSVEVVMDADRGLSLQGAIADVSAWDADDYRERDINMLDANRCILRVANSATTDSNNVNSNLLPRFFFLEFKTYPPRAHMATCTFPAWIQSLLASMKDESQQVDDYLSVSIAALEFVYLRERTDELLDYLSNGLPGKGMGATSRAAKGFIKKRIQTRSFLKLSIDSPRLKIPQWEGAPAGILLRLGDFGLKSWFQEGSIATMSKFSKILRVVVVDDDDKDWWRMLSLSILGLGWETYGEAHRLQAATRQMPVDLFLDLRKPTSAGRTILLNGSLSHVDMLLAYSDYVLCRSVLRENIGKKIDKERWDNIEKAYWMEQQTSSESVSPELATPQKNVLHHRVAYSSNARFVRYGQKSANDANNSREGVPLENDLLPERMPVNFKFSLGGLRLTLHRDDPLHGCSDMTSFNYDLALLRVENIETTMTSNESGDISFHLSLYRTFVFDLGDLGRLARNQYYQTIKASKAPKKIRGPSAFCVLAEGYTPNDQPSNTDDDAQLVVTVDTCPSSSIGSVGSIQTTDLGSEKVTIARVVVNHLSINVLVRPLREVISFFTCTWPLPSRDLSEGMMPAANREGAIALNVEKKANTKSSCFQIKLVTHYPRIFFVADESDPRSRALVLRGLAVINASYLAHQKKALSSSDEVFENTTDSSEQQITTAIDAHLHSLESYINPDVSWALGLQQEHAEMMGISLGQMSYMYSTDQRSRENDSDSSLGVALIEPVTTSIELCRVSQDRFPTLRSMIINMEPVSTMLSFEDLSLIRGIIKRLSSGQGKVETLDLEPVPASASLSDARFDSQKSVSMLKQKSVEQVVVVFQSSRLGLALKSEPCGGIVVEGVHNANHSPRVEEGDRLLSINGSPVESLDLHAVVETLTQTTRPTTIVFERYGTQLRFGDTPMVTENNLTSSSEGNPDGDPGHLSESCYTISFARGYTNGLSFERSPCCNAPVITNVNMSNFLESIVTNGAATSVEHNLTSGKDFVRSPRKGAVIVAVMGLKSTELGYLQTVGIIGELCESNRKDKDPHSESTFTLTFVELESHVWGNVDCVDIAVTGISLTFIDDVNGRDMPLFRGRLAGIEGRFERGIGIETSLIEAKSPIFISSSSKVAPLSNDESGEISNLDVRTWGHLARPIIKSFAILQAEVEYYHAKIAVWEPLIEPSQFCGALEWQPGFLVETKPKCGQLAIRLSDKVARSDRATPGSLEALNDVTVNLTDAAAEIIIRAFREWKDWIKTSDASPESEREMELPDTFFPLDAADPVHENGDPSTMIIDESYHTKVKLPSSMTAVPQKAAQAALLYAQKRGAATNKQAESSKPFVLRNRTGLELQFSYEKPDIDRNSSLCEGDADHSLLADGEDARFSMEMLSSSKSNQVMHSFRRGVKKVRTYEGRFPRLSIAFHAPNGVVLAPLHDLPASKVGMILRTTKCDSVNCGLSTVSLLWSVEVEDNRRILTISSAVQVNSTGLGTSIEVGFADTDSWNGPATSSITTLGSAKPGLPFYIPLWLTLRFQAVAIFVRPVLMGQSAIYQCSWSNREILKYSKRIVSTVAHSKGELSRTFNHLDNNSVTARWAWRETFNPACSISCETGDTIPFVKRQAPVWLSCRMEPQDPERFGFIVRKEAISQKGQKQTNEPHEDDLLREVITIGIDSSMTLRNMLPSHVEWEIAVKSVAKMSIVAGSGLNTNCSIATLAGGDCVEILACDVMESDVHARFRCKHEYEWSAWVSIAIDLSNITSAEGARTNRMLDRSSEGTDTATILVDQLHDLAPKPRQVNVQSIDECGGQLTLGLRMIPKLVKAVNNGVLTLTCYGIDVIVYAELWLRNKTNLSLSFGCPTFQIERDSKTGIIDDTVHDGGKMVAEAALLEIASVLEFGDKGKNLGNEGDRFLCKICPLPFQETSVLYHEVFEYIEMESSRVKRRWWACENPSSLRWGPSRLDSQFIDWHWLDDTWQIDCSGQTSREGWESCRSLVGSKDSFFSGNRIFSPNHPYRRRRWVRRWAADSYIKEGRDRRLYGEINGFHQPVFDSFSKAQLRAERRAVRHQTKGQVDASSRNGDEEYNKIDAIQISIKCGDGEWSAPANIPPTGSANGILRVPASRWPMITKTSWATAKELRDPVTSSTGDGRLIEEQNFTFDKANLSPELFELCYHVQDLAGDWGDFSRLLDVTPRFLLQNDSDAHTIEVKQSGAPNDTTTFVAPGSVTSFHWADFRLPELLSVRPYSVHDSYRWSGGFDISTLGMIPIRVRPSKGSFESKGGHIPMVAKSVRALVEIRPGSGGSGMKISFREEDPRGDGALFRIENHTPFPIWLAQDGVLANPSTKIAPRFVMSSTSSCDVEWLESASWSDERAEIDGDLIRPCSQTAYGLDVPFRQGKYVHRNVATMEELLRVRIGLAPLASRDGIETTKVIGLTQVGEKIRLNITKISTIAASGLARKLASIRVLGIVTTDGPTRVLKFSLMEKEDSTDILNALSEGMGYNTKTHDQLQKSGGRITDKISQDEYWRQVTARAALETLESKSRGGILSEEQAKRRAFFGDGKRVQSPRAIQEITDVVFSVQASFSGFLFSLVDGTPSEIAVVSLKGLNIAAKWDGERKADASVMISVDWLQVDNHMPGAPFRVAICPDDREKDGESGSPTDANPLLLIGVTFAPKHKTGILCLRNMTIAPRNLAVAVDLAFIVRLQRYFIGLQEHASGDRIGDSDVLVGVKHAIPLPNLSTVEEWTNHVKSGTGSPRLYFEGLTILSASINLSVAPARALTNVQAALEGHEAAAVHAAVRKGDIGLGSGLVGVHVGRTNKTALAVVRGVFKSILVDALLRLDGASLNLSGVALRNHISSTPQLLTFLGAHYVASMRSNLPALLGSLAAFGNPLGLIRGLGDGVSDFVNEPVKGLKKSMQELDPFLFVDGVARGTESLARHTVGGIAETASLLTETFSKNMAVLTLDRRYAQRRDRIRSDMRDGDVTFVEGVESGVVHLVRGVVEGVAGVVKAPMRGAERSGVEGFAKGIGKGLLGLLVKPMIGISDAATDFMIGVKGSVEGGQVQRGGVHNTRQIRLRRPMYGKDKVLRPYTVADAAAATLMLRTRLAGDNYLSHLDMCDRVALLSIKEMVILGPEGQEEMHVKFSHVKSIEVRPCLQPDGSAGWGIIILLSTPRRNGSEVEVVNCGHSRDVADELCNQINQGLAILSGDV